MSPFPRVNALSTGRSFNTTPVSDPEYPPYTSPIKLPVRFPVNWGPTSTVEPVISNLKGPTAR